jgi:hypothetical protein
VERASAEGWSSGRSCCCIDIASSSVTAVLKAVRAALLQAALYQTCVMHENAASSIRKVQANSQQLVTVASDRRGELWGRAAPSAP